MGRPGTGVAAAYPVLLTRRGKRCERAASNTPLRIGLKNTKFDPIAYIESAFLDVPAAPKDGAVESEPAAKRPKRQTLPNQKRGKFRKTEMSAPRPRRARESAAKNAIDPELRSMWEALPRHIEFLVSYFDDDITSNYYGGEFKESRNDLIKRLLDPELSLEETSRLLGVCPATIRRYTNRGWLAHHRTHGGQRRFRLSDVISFVDKHGRLPEE